MKSRYNYLQDPGHGWIAVPVKDLHELGLLLTDFSPYSYRSKAGSTVYLEEDFDGSFFVEVFRKTLGHEPLLFSKLTDNRSFVRSLKPLRDFAEYAEAGRAALFRRRENFWKAVK